MHPDGEFTILGGVPIGLTVVAVGLATGIEELTLTGLGLTASACLIGVGFDRVAARVDG